MTAPKSSEPKFTPGPWMLDEETRPAEVCTVYHVGSEQNFVYVRGALGYWNADAAENLANAHLIAASPDLYEYAEVVVDWWYTGNPPPVPEHVAVALGELCLALAKARGEQP